MLITHSNEANGLWLCACAVLDTGHSFTRHFVVVPDFLCSGSENVRRCGRIKVRASFEDGPSETKIRPEFRICSARRTRTQNRIFRHASSTGQRERTSRFIGKSAVFFFLIFFQLNYFSMEKKMFLLGELWPFVLIFGGPSFGQKVVTIVSTLTKVTAKQVPPAASGSWWIKQPCGIVTG